MQMPGFGCSISLKDCNHCVFLKCIDALWHDVLFSRCWNPSAQGQGRWLLCCHPPADPTGGTAGLWEQEQPGFFQNTRITKNKCFNLNRPLQIVKCSEVSFCTFQMQWQLSWMFTKLLLQITWNWQSLNLCCDLDSHQSLSCIPVNYLFFKLSITDDVCTNWKQNI